MDVIDSQSPGSTVTYTFSGATKYRFAIGMGIKLSNNTAAALLIDDNDGLVWNRKSGGNWQGWKSAISNVDFPITGKLMLDGGKHLRIQVERYADGNLYLVTYNNDTNTSLGSVRLT